MQGTRLLDRYEITEKLGQGGRGVVYRAEDQLLGRQVAVKLLRSDIFDSEAMKCFVREARLVARLEHPGIVPLYDFNGRSEPFFLVMPILKGQTLHDLMEQGPLEQHNVLSIGRQMAEALAYSHSHGVLHRDLQPKNLMVKRGADGRLQTRLFDFGLAVDYSRQGDLSGLTGTPRFLSPEQLAENSYDQRSEVHALGIVLYECIVGAPAFEGNSLLDVARSILTFSPKAPSERGVKLDRALERTIISCLEKSPENRPQSAQELADTLQYFERRLSLGTLTTVSTRRTGQETVKGRSAELSSDLGSLADRLGDLLLVQGDYAAANKAYEAAREGRKENGEERPELDRAHHLRMAHLALRWGAFEEGLKHCELGLHKSPQGGGVSPVTFQSLASLIHTYCGELDLAEARLEAALEAVGQCTADLDSLCRTWLLRAQGNLRAAQGEQREALESYTKALELNRSTGERWQLSISLYNVGEASLALGNLAVAREHLTEAFLEKSTIGDRWGLAHVHHALAVLELEDGNLEPALLQIRVGLRLAEELGDPQIHERLEAALRRHQVLCDALTED